MVGFVAAGGPADSATMLRPVCRGVHRHIPGRKTPDVDRKANLQIPFDGVIEIGGEIKYSRGNGEYAASVPSNNDGARRLFIYPK